MQAADGVVVLGVERAPALHRVGKARVAHHDGDLELLHLALGLARGKLRPIGRQQQAARHHAEVLVAVGQRLGVAVMADIAEPGLLQELADALARIEPLGVELVGDDADLVVHDHLARDEAFPVARQRALPADEMVLVDPLPRAALEVIGHVGAVGDVEHELAGRAQDLADGRQDLLVILLVGEVAERVAHDGDAVEAHVGQTRVARVAFLEHDLQPLVLRPLLGEAHEIAGAVDAGHVLEAAACQLQAVAPLAAAQVEDVAIGLDRGAGDDEVDLAPRVLRVLDDVAVGLDVEGVEKLAPPLGGEVRLEIRNGTEA